MTVPAVVWLVVGITTLLVLTAFMITLVRQVKRLTASVVEFQREVQPVIEGIQRDAQAAQEHAEKVQERADAIRALREGDGRGGRSGARARR